MTDFPEIPGVATELSVDVGRVLSDNNYGSFRVGAILKLSLSSDASVEETFNAVQAWLEANVGKAVKAQQRAYDLKQQLEPAPDYGIADSRATPPPVTVPENPPGPTWDSFDEPVHGPNVAAIAPQGTSNASTGQIQTETWNKPGMTILYKKDGEPYLLIKGGNFTKHGAIAWKESLPFDISDWADRDENNVQIVYSLPDGLQDAIVQMKMKDGKLVPDKVIGFQ